MIAIESTGEATETVPLSLPMVFCFLLLAFATVAVALWRGRRQDRDARFARAHRIDVR